MKIVIEFEDGDRFRFDNVKCNLLTFRYSKDGSRVWIEPAVGELIHGVRLKEKP